MLSASRNILYFSYSLEFAFPSSQALKEKIGRHLQEADLWIWMECSFTNESCCILETYLHLFLKTGFRVVNKNVIWSAVKSPLSIDKVITNPVLCFLLTWTVSCTCFFLFYSDSQLILFSFVTVLCWRQLEVCK